MLFQLWDDPPTYQAFWYSSEDLTFIVQETLEVRTFVLKRKWREDRCEKDELGVSTPLCLLNLVPLSTHFLRTRGKLTMSVTFIRWTYSSLEISDRSRALTLKFHHIFFTLKAFKPYVSYIFSSAVRTKKRWVTVKVNNYGFYHLRYCFLSVDLLLLPMGRYLLLFNFIIWITGLASFLSHFLKSLYVHHCERLWSQFMMTALVNFWNLQCKFHPEMTVIKEHFKSVFTHSFLGNCWAARAVTLSNGKCAKFQI